MFFVFQVPTVGWLFSSLVLKKHFTAVCVALKEKPLSYLKNNRENIKIIAGAVTGILLTALYFLFIMKSPLVDFLRPTKAKQDILADAAAFSREFPVDLSRQEPAVSVKINEKLLRFVQYYRAEEGEFPNLSVGYWDIYWRGRDEAGTTSKYLSGVKYDFSGNLVEFRKRVKDLNVDRLKDLSEDDAFLEARYFLETLNINTPSLVITNKDINKEGKKTVHKFTFKNKLRVYPGLIETYTVEVFGSKIKYFRLDKTYDPQVTGHLEKDVSNEIGEVVAIFTWLTICFILAVQFIKKLRRDELEFKRAFYIGILITLAMFILSFIKGYSKLPEILVDGVVGGVLGTVGMLIVFSTAESQTRETWPGKLAVTDLLFQGKVWVRETGEAILRSFFIGGVTLFFFGALILFTSSLNIGNLIFSSHSFGALHGFSNFTEILIKNFFFSLAVCFIVLSFWPAYLKIRIPGRILLLPILMLTFIFAGLHVIFFRPATLSVLLVAPIALAWAVIVFRFNLLTVFLSLFGVYFFLDLPLILLVPETLFALPGMVVMISTAFIFVLGLYLIFRPKSAKDYGDYVPGYVGRIAEKERFLKELEIARSVQMRFLPQQVPDFPNLEIVSLCRPAMEVGGDYYDFIRLDERYMSILIGDVSGKGVSAAFYMTMIKGIIKTLARKIKEPAVLLAEANEIFYENAPRNVFITVIYGVFDLEEKTLTVASAGHNPLIAFRRKEKKTTLYNPAGIALGFTCGEAYSSLIKDETVPIAQGDIFVFYTDGVTEAMNMEQEIYGEQKLREVIEENAHLAPRLIEAAVIESVKRFSGEAPQHDDFTMVIVKITS